MKVSGAQTTDVTIELSKGEMKRVTRSCLIDMLGVKPRGILSLKDDTLIDNHTLRTTFSGEYCFNDPIKKDITELDKAIFMVYKELTK